MAATPIKHSPKCGTKEKVTCDACRKQIWLEQFPRSQWEKQALIYDRRRQELPAPLPRAFLERLAAEMIVHSDLFEPIIKYFAKKKENDSE